VCVCACVCVCVCVCVCMCMCTPLQHTATYCNTLQHIRGRNSDLSTRMTRMSSLAKALRPLEVVWQLEASQAMLRGRRCCQSVVFQVDTFSSPDTSPNHKAQLLKIVVSNVCATENHQSSARNPWAAPTSGSPAYTSIRGFMYIVCKRMYICISMHAESI